MADHMGMDPAEVHATAGWLESSAQEFTDELDKLMREVRTFVGGDWQGSAADTHHDAWVEWEQGARHVVAGLHHAAAALHRAADTVVGSDRGNADGIDGTSAGAR